MSTPTPIVRKIDLPATPISIGLVEDVARAVTVFYHGGCPDGIAGAWAVYTGLHDNVRAAVAEWSLLDMKCAPAEQMRTAGAAFVGIGHNHTLPEVELYRGRHVFYVDIVPSLEVASAVLRSAASVTVLDHHRGAGATVAELVAEADRTRRQLGVVFDETRSGAQIAWDYVHPGVARPAVLDYVGDRDTWAWKLPLSREVNKAIYVDGMVRSFGSLDSARVSLVPHEAAKIGAAYKRHEDLLVSAMSGRAYEATIESNRGKYRVLAINSAQLASEIGEALSVYAPAHIDFVVVWNYDGAADEIWVSARTTRDNVDLSAITPYIIGAIRGGGHPRAAGFTILGASPANAIVPVRAAM
jgi:hypothetical protein